MGWVFADGVFMGGMCGGGVDKRGGVDKGFGKCSVSGVLCVIFCENGYG